MATQRVQLTITDQRFFDDAQNKREAVRVWSAPFKLPQYVESWDSQNEQGKVWVKVPKIPANGSVDLYMYYGNSEAVSESNPEQVFEFFDDFDTFDTSKWKAGDNVPNIEEAVIFSGYTCLHWKKTAAGVNVIYSRYADLNTQNVIIESRFYPVGALDKPYGISANRWGIDSDWAMVSIHGGDYGKNKGFIVATETEAWGSPEKNLWNWNNWYIYQLVAKQDLTIGRLLTDGWGLIKEHVINDGTNINYLQMFMVRGGTGTYNLEAYVDWVRVRKYAEQEPTVVVGEEEASDVSGWLYRRKITITNPNSYDLEHFQVAIDLDGSNFDFTKANADGSDIRVAYASARYSLPYYIETWDTSTPQAVIWVGIDSETRFFVELDPANTTDESDESVMNLDEATNYSLSKFEKYA